MLEILWFNGVEGNSLIIFMKLRGKVMLKNNKKEKFSLQIVDKTTKISMNILMFWSFFKKNKPYD